MDVTETVQGMGPRGWVLDYGVVVSAERKGHDCGRSARMFLIGGRKVLVTWRRDRPITAMHGTRSAHQPLAC